MVTCSNDDVHEKIFLKPPLHACELSQTKREGNKI